MSTSQETRVITVNGQEVVQVRVPSFAHANLNHGGETWMTIGVRDVGIKTSEMMPKPKAKSATSILYPRYGYEKVGVYCYQPGGKQGKVFGSVPVTRKHKTTAHHQGDLPKPLTQEWKRGSERGVYHMHGGQWVQCPSTCSNEAMPYAGLRALMEHSPWAKHIRRKYA